MHLQLRNHLGTPAALAFRAVLAAAALVALLLLAPEAQASKAVIGTFGGPGGEGAGQLNAPKGIAVNRTGAGGVSPGDVYVVDSKNSRISEFSASGAFVRAFGYDVVASGPGDSGANEQQKLTIDATGGTFALKVTKQTLAETTNGSNVVRVYAPTSAFHVGDAVSGVFPLGTTITAVGVETLTLSGAATVSTMASTFRASETTASLPFDATAAELQTALEALPSIGAGNVAVTGEGPGSTAPFAVEYKGALGHDDVYHAKASSGAQESVIASLSEGLSGAIHSATISTTVPGGGYEVCEGADGDLCKAAPACNQGESAPEACQEAAAAGAMNQSNGVAIDQTNGNVYVVDANSENAVTSNSRVNVYSATGAFEGAFGWHVDASDPKEELQFCTAASGCQAGTRGGGAGQLTFMVSSLPAVDPSNGHLYVPDGNNGIVDGNERLDEFSPTLNPAKEAIDVSFVKAFGYDVVQSGPDNVTPVNEVQLLTIPSGVSGKFTLSFEGKTTVELTPTVGHNGLFAALEKLVSDIGGRIDPVEKGTGQWQLVFGDQLENEPVPQITVDNSKLSGGEATVTTLNEGVNIYERCEISVNPSDVCKAGLGGDHLGQFGSANPSSVAVDSSGTIYVVEYNFETRCGPPAVTTFRPHPCRVQKFNPAATAVEEFAPAQLSGALGTDGKAVAPTDVAVDPTNDHVLVAKKEGEKAFRFLEFDSSGTLLDSSPAGAVLKGDFGFENHGLAIGTGGRFYFSNPLGMVDIFGPPPAPSATIGAVTNIGATTATFHGTVTPPAAGPEGERFATSYHFEFSTDGVNWSRFPAKDVDVGNGGGAGSPNECPVGNPPTCNVSEEVTGLQPNAEYEARLVATTGTATTTGTVSFQTEPGAPSISGMLAEEIEETQAKLTGFINPNNQPTTYHFEWGTDTSYGNRVPVEAEADAGSGGEAVKVSTDLSGLKGGTIYHFRLVAESATGATEGPDHQFSTLNAAGLPDGRGYELVSPADKRPQGAVSKQLSFQLAFQSSSDGNSFLFPIYNGLADSTTGGNVAYLAAREAGGWQSTQASPPSLLPRPEINLFNPAQIEYFSPDLSCAIVEASDPLSPDVPEVDIENGVYNLFRRNSDGSFTLITNEIPDNPGTPISEGDIFGAFPKLNHYALAGASPDCERIYFRSDYHLLANASKLYEWDHGTLRNAGLLPDGTVPSGFIGMGDRPGYGDKDAGAFGTRLNSVSRDGSRFFFNATSDEGADAGKRAIFVRKSGGVEVVDASQPTTATPSLGARYETASPDGSHVFFAANYGLTPESSSGPSEECVHVQPRQLRACALYDYNVDTGELTDISADVNPADSKGAAVDGVIAVSDDGSHVYFAARGQLIPGVGNTYAQNAEGSSNVYLYHEGGLSYVASIDSTDLLEGTFQEGTGNLLRFRNTWTAQVTPDGRHLLFAAKANVTGYGSGGAFELYRYSADDGEVVCVSCRRDGLPSVAGAEYEPLSKDFSPELHYSRTVSDDGSRIFFTMPDILAPGAVGGNENVYEWERAQIYLLASFPPTGDSRMLESSPNGDDVFILTTERFAPQDTDFSADVYDVRAPHSAGERIGFPVSEAPVPCDPLGEGCQQGAGAPPVSRANSGSAAFNGAGNPASKPHKHRHHRKHSHRRKVHKPRHGARRAGHNRGGAK